MGIFLNSTAPYESYKRTAQTRFFVDKTWLIDEILHGLERDNQRCVCITRPRRFGKTVMANMLCAFLGNAADSGDIFSCLKISRSPFYRTHRNQYDVIYIDFSEELEKYRFYDRYISRILDGVKADLRKGFPEIAEDDRKSL